MIQLITNTNSAIQSPHYELGSIQDVVDYCSAAQVLGVDTETEGFDFTCKKMFKRRIKQRN